MSGSIRRRVDNGLSVVIVGAGLAGANAALELRRLNPNAHVTLIGSEAHLPYQRPPLSKGFLRGTEQFADALVAPRSEYERLGIDLVLGRRVVKLEPEFKRIRLEGDEVVPYDRALIATGGRKRSGAGAAGACSRARGGRRDRRPPSIARGAAGTG